MCAHSRSCPLIFLHGKGPRLLCLRPCPPRYDAILAYTAIPFSSIQAKASVAMRRQCDSV